MNYPAGYTLAIHDAVQGRDEVRELPARDCYDAIRDFLYALDRGFLACKDDSAFIDQLRRAVAAETARRAADEAELRAAGERLRILGRVR